MRLRNVKGASNIIDASNYVIKDFKGYKGHFKDIFKNNNPIYIEIGTGKGKFIIENALKYSNINYIGIEKYDSVLVRALEKVDNLKIDNLRFIRADAINISDIFEKEVDKIYLNFSDPWPKDRHYKRRLTSPNFLERYESIFRNKKVIEMKTDNRRLFEYSLKTLTDNGYKIADLSLDLYNSDNLSNNIETEYEIKFVRSGSIIYKGTFIKNI